MAQGLINNGTSVTKSFSPNQLELLADYTVSGSAITSYTFSGLKLNADEEIVLVSTAISGANNEFRVMVNGIVAPANYYSQVIVVDGTAPSGYRANTCGFLYVTATSGKSYANINIKLTNNGYVEFQANSILYIGGSSITLINYHITSMFTTSQITSLSIFSENTNGIGIGSRFQLYKVKGQVVQTWATT